ncbi:MAG: hypothetical protein BA863_18460 [Desulfovibrio sp. S3730MH75]|nr:MAG: hypothetical protein BA863_18460 [Desulfovibrio sp. S3730MH75]
MELTFEKYDIDLSFIPTHEGISNSSYVTSFSDASRLTAFCCSVSGDFLLKQKWREISDCISHDYLTGAVSDFEYWNSYLVFICNVEVPKALKYEIENDKLYMRKLVEKKPAGWDDSTPEKAITELLNRRLLLSHIELSGYETADTPILPELSQWGKDIVKQEIPSDPRKEDSKKARAAWGKAALEDAMSVVSDEN